MKTMAFLIFLALFSGMQAQDLSSYLDKKRVVLLFSGNQLPEQQAILKKNAEGLRDRDVVGFSVSAKEEKLHRKYEVKPGQFLFVLLGKDGGEKFRSLEIVTPEKLFAIIDAMPMRREEMARKRRAAD